jgi:ABC-type transport system involved in multi-copper enzyme maturation permease subunit
MTTTIIRSLVRKDLRINASVFVVGLLAWLSPFVMVSVVRLLNERRFGGPAPGSWVVDLLMSGTMSLVFTAFTALLLGANAFAAERSDRSAEFLAILPATRRQIVASKLLVALVPLAAIWTADLVLLVLLNRALPPGRQTYAPEVEGFVFVGAMTLMAFGVAWFASSILERPLTALGVTLLVAFGVMLGAWLAAWLLPDAPGNWLSRALYVVLAVLGLAGFVAGTWIALRRVEP